MWVGVAGLSEIKANSASSWTLAWQFQMDSKKTDKFSNIYQVTYKSLTYLHKIFVIGDI